MSGSRLGFRAASLRAVGWSMLALYLAMFSPLGIGLAVSLGTLDRGHHLTLQAQAGALRMVLHHAQEPGLHQHGLLARSLTFFTPRTNPAEPDHVLQFSALDSVTGLKSAGATSARVDGAPCCIGVTSSHCWIAPHRPALPGRHLPPDRAAAPPGVRTTVWLI